MIQTNRYTNIISVKIYKRMLPRIVKKTKYIVLILALGLLAYFSVMLDPVSSGGATTDTPAKPKTSKKRRNPPFKTKTCENCFQRNFTFLHKAPGACSSSVELILTVLVKPNDFQTRDHLRGSYLRWTKNNTSPLVRYVFLIGSTTNMADQEKIDKEAKVHHDIVQQDFIDAYNKLTLKVLMGLEWATKHCSSAKYVMKVDADVYVSIKKIYGRFVRKAPKMTNAVIGNCIKSQHPPRHKGGKWAVSKNHYSHSRYPPYCQGPSYLVPMHVAKDIVRVSPRVPYLKLEDVYIGLCLRALDYPIRHVSTYKSPTNFGGMLDITSFPCSKMFSVTTNHHSRPYKMKQLWDKCFGPNYPEISK